MEPYWDIVKQIVRESDIVLEVLDARAVEISRNEQLERLIKETGRPRILVINKSDLVSKKELEMVFERLSKRIKDARIEGEEQSDYIVYVSNKQKRTIRGLITRIKQVFSKHGKRKNFLNTFIIKKPHREAKGDIIVGVVGYPNVGKSSIINALAFKNKAKVSSKAGTTHGIHWISAGNEIKLIDTPGVIPLSRTDEASLGIIAARGPEKMKDPEIAAGKIIEIFMSEKKLELLEAFYNFKLTEEQKENPYFILEALSIAKHHLRKGGLPDEKRTAIMFIRDWQTGKLRIN